MIWKSYKNRCPRSLHYSSPSFNSYHVLPNLVSCTHLSTCCSSLWARRYLWDHLAQLPHYRHVNVSLEKVKWSAPRSHKFMGEKSFTEALWSPQTARHCGQCVCDKKAYRIVLGWRRYTLTSTISSVLWDTLPSSMNISLKTNLLFGVSTSTISFIHKWLSITNAHRHCSGHGQWWTRKTDDLYLHKVYLTGRKCLYNCIVCVNNYSMC